MIKTAFNKMFNSVEQISYFLSQSEYQAQFYTKFITKQDLLCSLVICYTHYYRDVIDQ